jgi:hypothetical protein
MMRVAAICHAAGPFAAPAAAQQLIGQNFTSLSAEEMRNARGQPLTGVCAIVQQDRAHHHSFGLHNDGDQGDPVCGPPGCGRARVMSLVPPLARPRGGA